jgi:hypothetical protein
MAETGPFRIGVSCLARKAKLVLDAEALDFGPVVRGDSGARARLCTCLDKLAVVTESVRGSAVVRKVSIKNEGALAVTCSAALADAGALWSMTSSATIPGYGSGSIEVRFTPPSSAVLDAARGAFSEHVRSRKRL